MDTATRLVAQDRPTARAVAIYALSDPRTGHRRYIGKATNPARRLRDHLAPGQLTRYRSKKNSWLKGLAAEGLRPTMEIITWVAPDDADHAERAWIQIHLRTGAPLTNGTEGGDGGRMTPDVAARVGAANRGLKRTAETRAQMSASAKQRCASEAERERLRSISNGTPPVHMGEKNPQTKLSDPQVRELRERAAAGEPLRALAAEYGITPASVTQIVTGKTRGAAGGPIREAKPRSILTDEDVVEIRRLVGDGVSQSKVARQFRVHPSHVSDIISGRRRSSNKELYKWQ